jgi:hypothetical protein
MSLFTRRPVGTVSRLATANGWRVILHQGQDYVVADPAGQLPCNIHIYYRQAAPILILHTSLPQPFNPLLLPAGLFAGLMARHQLFGTFRTQPAGQCRLRFVLTYTALTAGLTEEYFGRICRVMARDIGELEAALREQGLM